MAAPSPSSADDTLAGFAYAVAAYGLWGFMPLYMKALAHVPPSEVVAHRVLWSIPVAGAILWATGRTADLKTALRTPRMLGMAAVTAVFLSVNWGLYVWAIGAGHALDAALGYYMNPLFSVLLGATLLGERPSRPQVLAIALAAAAVLLLTVQNGRLPLPALGMMLTWGGYAYFRRTLPIGPNQGFLLEVLLLLPLAAAGILWLTATGQSHFFTADAGTGWLLFGTGIVTAVPLILYAHGAKLLRLSTIGMLQYIAPTMIFLTAVLVFDEPFGPAERIAFPMIWAALALYTLSLLRRRPAPA